MWNGPGLVPAVHWPFILEGHFPFHALAVYKRNDKKHKVCRIRPDGDTVTVATVSIRGMNGFLPLSRLQSVQMPEGVGFDNDDTTPHSKLQGVRMVE